MSVKIFRDDNWNRIRNGAVSRRDIMHLDGEKDRELIRYLIAHAPDTCRRSVMQYAAERYGMCEVPEPPVNADDPSDAFFWEYIVLREQAVREYDRDVLIDDALHSPDKGVAAFAFCRLTGYSFTPGECDAYSYRSFSCDILPGMTADDIRDFCRMMIAEGGPFRDEAGICLHDQ